MFVTIKKTIPPTRSKGIIKLIILKKRSSKRVTMSLLKALNCREQMKFQLYKTNETYNEAKQIRFQLPKANKEICNGAKELVTDSLLARVT